MSAPAAPLVVATLEGRSADAVLMELSRAADAGADAAEVRFDRWSPDEWNEMGRLFPSRLPLMATLRSSAEGGEGPAAKESRAKWRQLVNSHPFTYIDREWARDPALAETTASLTSPTEVVSTHLPTGTSMADALARLATLRKGPGIAKVVVPASVRDALEILIPGLSSTGTSRFVAHTTGASGPLLRAWARRLGLALVFASVRETARPARESLEPAQLPVSRLRGFLDAGDAAPLFAVVGRPIAHSLSPDLHHFWMKAVGSRGLYVALEIGSADELDRSAPRLAAGGFRGLNVTHPLKEFAMRVATRVGESARLCGCANMLTFSGSEVEAENTDLSAVQLRLEELEASGTWDGAELLVVGGGGAARATLAAARARGSRAIILRRSPERGQLLAAEFGAVSADTGAPHPCSLVVHATPVGHAGTSKLGVDLLRWLGPSSYVLDFVYRPERDEVAGLTRSTGARYEDGRALLAYSAAASFGRWWRTTIPMALVRQALSEVA